jgi:hypothetical protein
MRSISNNRTSRALSTRGTTARFLVAAALATGLLGACDVHTPVGPGSLFSIAVTPNATLAINATQQFVAVGRDAENVIISITPVWSIVAGGGAIDNAGFFTAGSVTGTFTSTVRATSGGKSGFATVTVTAPPPPIILGSANTYGILAGSTVTCAGAPGTINADVGVWPGSTTTGFPPCTITGGVELATPVAGTAQGDLTTAYNQLAGLACGTTVTPADLGGRTLAPGVYCAATSMGVTGTVTLDGQGDPNAVFVFQIGSTLTTGTIANIALIGGAQARNVWWQVGASATLGTGTTFRGNILALTSITLVDNATMLGRALARNGAVSLGTNNSITLP